MRSAIQSDGGIVIFWFRRDLRLVDNRGLLHALRQDLPVVPLFIFDRTILDDLPDEDDARVSFIHNRLKEMQEDLRAEGGDLLVEYGKVEEVWDRLLARYDIKAVFTNRDYEPYAIQRDEAIRGLCAKRDVSFFDFKDQVVFDRDEVVKDDGDPYTVYTPYMKKWRQACKPGDLEPVASQESLKGRLLEFKADIPSLADIGFIPSELEVPDYDISEKLARQYPKKRNIPAAGGTTRLSVHLRFGTVGIRTIAQQVKDTGPKLLNELIWREFFMQILYHYPRVVNHNFREKYDALRWRNNEDEFQVWCDGRTGYPIVDAGMRELNATGYMHNRVRMVVASFLCKHLLIDWRWGEAYFARKLLDYELSSNNGNWQWAAGTGCDAAPYFRIFNPWTQADKFDPANVYIKQWVPEHGTDEYPTPMVEHKVARERALERYGEV